MHFVLALLIGLVSAITPVKVKLVNNAACDVRVSVLDEHGQALKAGSFRVAASQSRTINLDAAQASQLYFKVEAGRGCAFTEYTINAVTMISPEIKVQIENQPMLSSVVAVNR